MEIEIINGPNLNLLGVREPGIYGSEGFDTYLAALRQKYPDVTINYYQSNEEGKLIDRIHATGFTADGIILNAGAYTHTSIALHDAIRAVPAPVVEVHISNGNPEADEYQSPCPAFPSTAVRWSAAACGNCACRRFKSQTCTGR